MEPVLAVVMPVYNQEKYLVETIESVLNQTFADFEFIILDDGSTDSSAKIIAEYATKDKRIIALYEKNAGKCAATNNVVSKAKAKWCAFLDADDIMLPNRLEKQLAFHLSHPEVDASSCHCLYVNQKGLPLGVQRYPFLKTIEECQNVVPNNQIINCAFTGLMVSREVFLELGGLRSQFWPAEDFEFANRIIEKGHILLIIQENLMKYRVHTSSITNSNLWHSYVDINGYTTHCISLRRAGKPEVTFEEYLRIREKDAWWIKWNRKRFYYSQIFHREAGFALYSKNYVKFIWHIFTATLLSPNYVIASIRNRMHA